MKHSIGIVLVAAFILVGARNTMATEEAKYTVVKKDDSFEIRDYPPHVVAEIIVEGELENAGSKAFNSLFRYISGDNHTRNKVAMTSPVSQQPVSQKINMTAPVGQQRIDDKWAVSFMMPDRYTLETLPVPDNSNVTLRQVPARRIASVRYSGFWSEKSYLENKSQLETWINKNKLTIVGDAVWARYDAPFTPWFLRRNEILIPVAKSTD
ncbi:MAG: heme-binding protein [Methylococcales bacterium]|nr:heme-binding protein [Methylococcales bacterium]